MCRSWRCAWALSFFFFQAEDGIRATSVTGVQTCALPISPVSTARCAGASGGSRPARQGLRYADGGRATGSRAGGRKIGRASCRERGEISVGGGGVKNKKSNREGRTGDRRHENEEQKEQPK